MRKVAKRRPGNSRFREITNGGLGSRISRRTRQEEMGENLECKVHYQKATEGSTTCKPQPPVNTSTSMSETRIIQPPSPLTVARTTEDAALHRVGKIREEAVAVPPSLLKGGGGVLLCAHIEFSHV
jgi:hypothetical protein